MINKGIKDSRCRSILEDLLKKYTSPAFGVLPKHEIDMMMYEVLQRVGYLSPNPTPYELVWNLKVTRSKAQSLIYESNLRQIKANENKLEEELKELLTKGNFLVYNDKVAIEVENPLLRDFIKQCLKKVNCITDASYSNDILRMTPNAYQKLCETYAKDTYDELISSLRKEGVEVDENRKVFIELIKSLATMAGGEGAGSLVEIANKKINDVVNHFKKWKQENRDNKNKNAKNTRLK